MIGYSLVAQSQTCTPTNQLMFYQDFETNQPTLPELSNAGLTQHSTAGQVFGTKAMAIHNSSNALSGTYGPVNASFATDVKVSINFLPILVGYNGNKNFVSLGDDYLSVLVSLNNGQTWSREIVMYSNEEGLKYDFSSIVSQSLTYKGTGLYDLIALTSSNKVNKVELLFPNGTDLSKLAIRVEGLINKKKNDPDKHWVFDNIFIEGKFIETKTWNGSTWVALSNPKKTLPPTSTEKVVIDANYTTQNNGSFTACECTINSGKTLTINPDTYVSVYNDITNNGIVNVLDDANLIQVNDNGKFTGNPIKVNRSTKLKKNEYNYWGSPVSNQNLLSFSPSTSTSGFYTYNESTDLFARVTPGSNSFASAKGYAILAPSNYSTSGHSTFTGTFTGTPNNGIQTIQISKNKNGNNLVGNPYPSNISFRKLYEANSSIIEPIAYVWTNTNPNPTKMQGSNYSGANYAIVNLSGGIPALNSTDKPTETISVGQGFIIKKSNPGTSNLVFNNNMRVSTKSKFSNARLPLLDQPKVWLRLTTPAQNFNTTLIGYIQGATDDIDNGYDTKPMYKTSDMFYSVVNSETLVIQGKSNNFSIDDKVQLGAVYYEPGNYEISIAQVEGIFNGAQDVYLKDNQLNKTVNLSQGPYQFQAETGVDNTRFEIVYKTDSTLGVDNVSKTKETVVYKSAENIIVENNSNKITSVQVFDATGKLVASAKPNSNQFSIENSKLQKGLVIFKISLNDKIETKKFLVK